MDFRLLKLVSIAIIGYGLLGFILGSFLSSFERGLGILSGCIISFFEFNATGFLVKRILTSPRQKVAGAVLLSVKSLVVLGLVALLLISKLVEPVGMLLGLLSLVVCVAIGFALFKLGIINKGAGV